MPQKTAKLLTVKELEQIKVLRASGLSFHAIAVQIDRDPKTVKKVCLEPEASNQIQEIKEELSGMFEGLAKRMITSITDADIQKINAYQRTVSAGISTDKMRLLRDQSTDNIAIDGILRSAHNVLFGKESTKPIMDTPQDRKIESTKR